MKRRRSNDPVGSQVRNVSVDELFLDISNPRIAEKSLKDDQTEILRVLWREMAVDEIVSSIAANGFFRHEPVFAARESGRLVVIEGNRRVAAVKLLRSPDLQTKVKASGVPPISSEMKRQIASIPVVECTRDEIWHYIGFKHVHGPQQWESYSKAKYIARVHQEQDIPLETIAEQIGDTHLTVKRLYRALMVIEQAEREAVFNRNDRQKKRFAFSHLYTGLDRAGIPKYIGLGTNRGFKKNPVPKAKIKNLGELLRWLYGSKSEEQAPLIKSQNPDLRMLDETLLSPNGIAALRRGLPLKVSLDISKGDEQLFREALVQAKRALEEAKGKVLNGFRGEVDLLEQVSAIERLSKGLCNEMKEIASSHT